MGKENDETVNLRMDNSTLRIGEQEFKGAFFEVSNGMVLVNGMMVQELFQDRQYIELVGNGTLITDKAVIIYGNFDGKIEAKTVVINGQTSGSIKTDKLVINSNISASIEAEKIYDNRPEEK